MPTRVRLPDCTDVALGRASAPDRALKSRPRTADGVGRTSKEGFRGWPLSPSPAGSAKRGRRSARSRRRAAAAAGRAAGSVRSTSTSSATTDPATASSASRSSGATRRRTERPAPPAARPTEPARAGASAAVRRLLGPFGRVQAKRLLDRAGFGPRPGRPVARPDGLQRAVRVADPARRHRQARAGRRRWTSDGDPIAPADAYGHDHLWWLDRMVRSNQPLVERWR